MAGNRRLITRRPSKLINDRIRAVEIERARRRKRERPTDGQGGGGGSRGVTLIQQVLSLTCPAGDPCAPRGPLLLPASPSRFFSLAHLLPIALRLTERRAWNKLLSRYKSVLALFAPHSLIKFPRGQPRDDGLIKRSRLLSISETAGVSVDC